jgi:aldehyde dehydrogenase (NAD+)
MDRKGLYIDGCWADSVSGDVINVINPSTGEQCGEIARGNDKDINNAVQAARKAAAGKWKEYSPVERGRCLTRLGELILEHQDQLIEIESNDVGKPLTQAKNDVMACARYCEFYAGAVDKLYGETIPYQNGYTVLTLREPHGVTAHIIPWNYPLQVIGRSVIGALAAGNAVVVKPGEDASLSALFLGELTEKAGFPAGSINIVTGYGEEAGAALASHPDIDHLSFTGSQKVGTLVQKAAANNSVQVTLELGGKSPQIVFDDADQDKALAVIINASIQNAGQTVLPVAEC